MSCEHEKVKTKAEGGGTIVCPTCLRIRVRTEQAASEVMRARQYRVTLNPESFLPVGGTLSNEEILENIKILISMAYEVPARRSAEEKETEVIKFTRRIDELL